MVGRDMRKHEVDEARINGIITVEPSQLRSQKTQTEQLHSIQQQKTIHSRP